MARRRRTRGAWFPTLGTTLFGNAEDNASGRAFSIATVNNNFFTAVTPLTFDVPFEGDFAIAGTDSLADILGSGYLLRRVVGKMFAQRISGLDAVTFSDDNPAVLFGAGLLVARANDAGSGGGRDTPIGSATQAELNANYNPLEIDCIREPWIWRRTWILGRSGSEFNVGTTQVPAIGSGTTAAYPASTALYGSVMDGPHMDSKVKRLVTGDNRLWLALSTALFPFGATNTGETLLVTGYFDYRIYGSLRKPVKSGAF